MNTAQTVCKYTHSLSSDCTKELLTGTPEKVKEMSGWEGGRLRKTICLPFISVRELNQRTTQKVIANSVCFSLLWIVDLGYF